jgi:hypothetical protein
MWRRVDLVRTDVSEERIVCIFGVKKIRELRAVVGRWQQKMFENED